MTGRSPTDEVYEDERQAHTARVDHVRNAILRGDFPTEATLDANTIARSLDMSKTPVRHAFQLLLQEGLLEIGRRRRFVVRGFSSEHSAEVV